MSVRMYDCDFGDCFVIQEEHVSRPLYVDFGVHSRSQTLRRAALDNRYRDIIKDMPVEKDIVITHYHDDHYSGLIYMYNNGLGTPFMNVYIPDVWDADDDYKLIKLLVLSTIYDRTTRSHVNIADFLLAICNQTVHLVQRGDDISSHMVALWPDKKQIKNKISDIDISDLPSEILDSIGRIASLLYISVQSIANRTNGELFLGNVQENLEECSMLIQNLYSDINEEWLPDELKVKLGDFGNNVSIVFRNIRLLNTGRNMLFTGDVDAKIMKELEVCTDYPRLLKHNSIIKLPHHGTENKHYFDFKGYITNKGTYIIPNGSVAGWFISNRYCTDAAIKHTKMIVANDRGFDPISTIIPSLAFSIAGSGQIYKDIV